MKIAVIGTGYVGLVTGTCFAETGNHVTCVDTNREKIDNLNKGIIPIYEPGLEDMVRKNMSGETLFFTTSIEEALKQAAIIFIAVGTPMGEDGSADLQYVLKAAASIGRSMKHDIIIVNKSTVPVGTAEKVNKAIEDELKKRKINLTFTVASNPEFLREGSAINDAMQPDRVVIGSDDHETMEVMKELYRPFTGNSEKFIAMDIRSAEMTKYAANAMLATKISFMNEISRICEILGADVNNVRTGLGSDRRIGYSFIYPGVGYGGSCFPKDVQALIKTSHDSGYSPEILNAVENVNKSQVHFFLNKIYSRFGSNLQGKIFSLWGLAFKPGTDDMREAPSITIIKELTARGAVIHAYDPKAVHEARSCYLKNQENIIYFDSKYLAARNSDALIIATEWKEFRNPDFDEMHKLLKNPVIFDGRNQYDRHTMKKFGFEYYMIGVNDTGSIIEEEYLRKVV